MLQSIDTNALKIGMTKEEAQRALRIKPLRTVAAKNFPESNTIVEVVYYATQIDSNGFWLYFNNDKLNKWEPASLHHQPYLDDLVPIR